MEHETLNLNICFIIFHRKTSTHSPQNEHKLMNLLFINITGTTQTHTIKHKLNNNVKSVPSIIYMEVQRKSLKITHHIPNLFTISPFIPHTYMYAYICMYESTKEKLYQIS